MPTKTYTVLLYLSGRKPVENLGCDPNSQTFWLKAGQKLQIQSRMFTSQLLQAYAHITHTMIITWK